MRTKRSQPMTEATSRASSVVMLNADAWRPEAANAACDNSRSWTRKEPVKAARVRSAKLLSSNVLFGERIATDCPFAETAQTRTAHAIDPINSLDRLTVI